MLRPADRDLTPLLAGKHAGHGFGRVYPNIVQLEATLALLEANPDIVIPRDNRRLVEGALHPEALARIAEANGATWIVHERQRRGGKHAEATTAAQVALDLSQPFRSLVFQDESVATRLGARDLIVDIDPPLAGPFGSVVARFHIPAWLVAADVTNRTEAERIDDTRFRLGSRTYRYDRWGLRTEG